MVMQDGASTSRWVEIQIGDGDRDATATATPYRRNVNLYDLADFTPPGYEEGTVDFHDAASGRRVERSNDWRITPAELVIRGYHPELIQATGVRVSGGRADVMANARAGAGVPQFDAYEEFVNEAGQTRVVRHHFTGRIRTRAPQSRRENELGLTTFTVVPTGVYWQWSRVFTATATVTALGTPQQTEADEWYDFETRQIWRGGVEVLAARKAALGI